MEVAIFMKKLILVLGFWILFSPLCSSVESSTKPGNESKPPPYAWKHSQYVPPDYKSFFPDDEQGAEKLNEFWKAHIWHKKETSLSDKEIFDLVRNGLKRFDRKMEVLRWLGNRYIWGKKPQHPEAIEIMYHAAGGPARSSAIYFGLSVVRPKTPNIMKTLVDICMEVDDPNDLHRVAWGASGQKDEILEFLVPYLSDPDDEVREKAMVVEKILRGELKAFEWSREKKREKAQEEYAHKLPEIKEKLASGDSKTRKETLHFIGKNSLTLIMDDSFIEAWAACAKDPDPEIRREVARTFGNRWIWSQKNQNPGAIELMLRLSHDEDRNVRYKAVYFGLSTVWEPSDAVMRRLLQIAMTDHEHNMYGRVQWAVKRHPEKAARILESYMNDYETNHETAVRAFQIYKNMTGKQPPNPDRFKGEEVQDALRYLIVIGDQGDFKPKDEHEFAAEVESSLDKNIEANLMKTKITKDGIVGFLVVQGTGAKDAVKEMIKKNPKLALLQVEYATPEVLEFLEKPE